MSGPKNIYIAIVDDDESMCRSLGRLLRTANFQSITYNSAEAFLDDQKHPQFDCMVFDIKLGGMSGIELKIRLDSAESVTPVIFITSHDDPETRIQALATGAAGYFRKTEPGADILGCIRRAIASAQGAPDADTRSGNEDAGPTSPNGGTP